MGSQIARGKEQLMGCQIARGKEQVMSNQIASSFNRAQTLSRTGMVKTSKCI